MAATIRELNEDRNIEPVTGRDSVEPHFVIVFEHDAGANRDERAIPEQPSSVGSVADLLTLTPYGCAVVVDHAVIVHQGMDIPIGLSTRT